ncbi:SDR family NAD(P)-dependent oxidoreductase [Streptomyces sp. GXMU-J15]|uniref:SDR family NAD(P)-dependent oxidoreductase n=1 Tax=Streptomyces fuscus TaxID=3048495 RepID=A0ABT7IVZ1_9ACTN|nr:MULTISPECIES: SDR family NAD(P)-dependent oxidoreductase [Streptomyces]MDL2076242.1 SDR family NAD(P)-dependent oxidoreductase [Streptomyces fuscus]SBT94081.1 Short-chain dehydrogenase [Streptomyces sp. DI166]
MSVTRGPLYARTAVVTGAARGLGAGVALELSHRGARVALIDREGESLVHVRDALPGEAECWQADVTDETAMFRVAAAIRARFGPPSVVIAGAGEAGPGLFAETDLAVWRRVVEVNLFGSALTARAFLPDLFTTRGYLLQIASLAAAPTLSASCASRAGVESFAHALRAEVTYRQVGVGIAYIGLVGRTDTDRVRDTDEHPVLRDLRGHLPPSIRRALPVAEVTDRLVTAVERRRPAVYVPRSLRAAQLVRAGLPPLVTLLSRRELARLAAPEPLTVSGRTVRAPAPVAGDADRTPHP